MTLPSISSTFDLREIDGATVLIRSTRDWHHPPAAMRGSIEVREAPAQGGWRVRLVLDFPELFNLPAHRRHVDLDGADLERLLASARGGQFEFTLEEELDEPQNAKAA